jgi:hypothetical protein
LPDFIWAKTFAGDVSFGAAVEIDGGETGLLKGPMPGLNPVGSVVIIVSDLMHYSKEELTGGNKARIILQRISDAKPGRYAGGLWKQWLRTREASGLLV